MLKQFIVKLLFSGSQRYGMNECEREVKRFVISCNIDKPKELYKRDLFVFSYFFDRAYQAGFAGKYSFMNY